MSITPVDQIRRRLPEAGRIRMGVKGGKQGRMSIDTWRFTSPDRASLDALAQLYGGEVKPWVEPKANPNQFELRSEAKELRVALPPDPLSTFYELWSGGGNLRRCDGVTCDLNAHDGRTEVPCICDAKGEMDCKLKVRLTVILPDVRFLGTWRLDTSSWNAAQEMPGVVDAILAMQGTGIVRAVLRNEARTEIVHGKRKKVQVPVLGFDATLDELAEGQAAIGKVERPELVPAAAGELERPVSEHWTVDVIEDAEVVEETPTAWDPISGEHEINIGLCRMWIDNLASHKKPAVLIRSRELALEMGLPIPTTLESIDAHIIDALISDPEYGPLGGTNG